MQDVITQQSSTPATDASSGCAPDLEVARPPSGGGQHGKRFRSSGVAVLWPTEVVSFLVDRSNLAAGVERAPGARVDVDHLEAELVVVLFARKRPVGNNGLLGLAGRRRGVVRPRRRAGRPGIYFVDDATNTLDLRH
jgi:hypothetical protein